MTLDIGGQKVKLIWAEMEEWGRYHHDARTIEINENLRGDEKNFTETLRHEMVHAALAIGGVSFGIESDKEEQLVRAMDSLFFPAWEKVITRVKRFAKKKRTR